MFGENVLGLSQGSVSELLSKPKPWHMLSIKGREPFIRMQMWLNDPTNIDRLSTAKFVSRPDSKRRFGLDSGRSSPSEDDVESTAKKMRQHAVDEHREALTIAFALDPYPNNSTLEFLSNELSLNVKTVTSWFQSHRQRLKHLHGVVPETLMPAGEGESSFDPTKFRILLAHRKMELHGGGFPFPINPALFGLPPKDEGHAAGDSVAGAGLDLRSRMHDYNDDGGEDLSDSASDKNNMDDDRQSPESSSRSSRRKPAAPQWVNPEWPADKEPEQPNDGPVNEQPINGVCVRNIPAYGDKDTAMDTDLS